MLTCLKLAHVKAIICYHTTILTDLPQLTFDDSLILLAELVLLSIVLLAIQGLPVNNNQMSL